MPIQLNLQEVFSTDNQVVLSDKLNFNFAKLIELGVGDIGPQGIQGPTGPVGPMGPAGPRGKKGSTIYTGSDQTAVTTAIIDDLFIRSNGTFYINIEVPNTNLTTWDEIFSITDILSTLDTPPSLKTELVSIDQNSVTYSADTKNKNRSIIRFLHNDAADISVTNPDGIEYGPDKATYRNSTFFLNNFDIEKYKTEFIDGSVTENLDLNKIVSGIEKGILTVYSNFVNSADDVISRYQIQLGSLYRVSTGEHRMTSPEQNLRIRHYLAKSTGASPINYFLSEFNAGGDTSFTGSIDASNSAFKFRASQLDSVSSVEQHNQISLYFGGSSALTAIAENDPIFTNNGILVERSTDPTLTGKAYIQMGINSNNAATLVTRQSLDINSATSIKISTFTSTLTDGKGVYFIKSGVGTEKSTSLGIGNSPNSPLTVFGTKSTDDSGLYRWNSDQVNIGTFTKNGWDTTTTGSKFVPRLHNTGSAGNLAIAAQISSYLGFNSYFNESTSKMVFTDRSENPAGTATTNGTGSAFIMTRDGSLHYIAYSNDQALVDIYSSSNDTV